MNDEETEDYFTSRQVALEEIFGPMDDTVKHALIPFDFGQEMGGGPHLYLYSNHISGTICTTAGMIGTPQKQSDAGNFELMMAFPPGCETKFGENLIFQMAYYPQEASLNSGQTMGLPPQMTEGTNIDSIIFDCYRRFKVGNIEAGLMLVVGISKAELEFKMEHSGSALIQLLKDNGVYPYTDLNRQSLI